MLRHGPVKTGQVQEKTDRDKAEQEKSVAKSEGRNLNEETKMGKVTSAAIDAAGLAVKISIGLIGVMALWLGIMKIADQAGAIKVLAKIVRPITKRLFPSIPTEHPAIGSMVMNIAAFQEADYRSVSRDIREIMNVARPFGVPFKVIVEVGVLTDEQIVTASELVIDCGADFIKTCTGFGPGRATIHNIGLIRETVGDRIGIKASGGVASLEDIRKLLPLEPAGVMGVITGKALYSGSLDLKEAIALTRHWR